MLVKKVKMIVCFHAARLIHSRLVGFIMRVRHGKILERLCDN